MCTCKVEFTSNVGHCAQCHLTFHGEKAFDRHQTHVRDDGRPTCVDPMSDGRKGAVWWQDDRGHWHYGPRMTETARAALRRGSGTAESARTSRSRTA